MKQVRMREINRDRLIEIQGRGRSCSVLFFFDEKLSLCRSDGDDKITHVAARDAVMRKMKITS